MDRSTGLPQWGAADAEIKVPFVENKASPAKPAVGQYIAIHAALTARDFLLISSLPVHSPAFFRKPLPIFPVLAVAVANSWFLCRPRRIKQVILLEAGSDVSARGI